MNMHYVHVMTSRSPALIALGATPAATPAAIGLGTWLAPDIVDTVAGFDECRRGNLNKCATWLGPVGALAFTAVGAVIVREGRSGP